MECTIELSLSCFATGIQITVKVPYSRDPEEYIDELLDRILADEFRYNCEWEFVK